MGTKRSGSQPFEKGPAKYFTGTLRIDLLVQTSDSASERGVSVALIRLFAATVISLSMLVSASAQTNQAGAASAQDSQAIQITRSGSRPSMKAPTDHFTGSATVIPLFQLNNPAHTSGSSITFEPGARTGWHSHPLGQTLIVTAGIGLVQRWGDPIEEIRPGDVVRIPAGVKHWHGASAKSAMTHIAIVEQLDGKSADWMENVTDAQYNAPIRGQATASAAPAPSGTPRPSPSQRAIGDFDPKLAEITDNVLYGDIWERTQLSKHYRSLVTVAALIAMNRPDQLRTHLARARQNGVTEEEVVETITQLAFYAGWPSAITAISVAKEVFQKN